MISFELRYAVEKLVQLIVITRISVSSVPELGSHTGGEEMQYVISETWRAESLAAGLLQGR